MQIQLKDVAHSYRTPAPTGTGIARWLGSGGAGTDQATDASPALHTLDQTFTDGGAYALLGPSGCGKTTLLNIISGLVQPSSGRVYFGDTDVTDLATAGRNIAQMFQFPVIYDTMTVYENLAFPLRNRKETEQAVDARVREIAAELELGEALGRRAAGLGAAEKQIISLGRGLVRRDVAAMLLDEPLTVIDPAQKWHLRRRLKALQQAHGITTVYVTHDQLEALTFAETILVMQAGRILQSGTPRELFENPAHPFVGYFIGSPGMNFLSCLHADGRLLYGTRVILGTDELPGATVVPGSTPQPTSAGGFDAGPCLLGIRPEYVRITHDENTPGVTGTVRSIHHRGADLLVRVRVDGHGDSDGAGQQDIQLLARDDAIPAAGQPCRLYFPREHIRLYPGARRPDLEPANAGAKSADAGVVADHGGTP